MSDVASSDDANELAAAVSTFADVSNARVGFSVRHVADQPGVLLKLLQGGDVIDVDEMIASGAYGSGYVMSLRCSEEHSSFTRDRSVNADVESQERYAAHFTGRGNPNPSFLYEDAEPIDVLVVINPERASLTRADGCILTDVISEISDLVFARRAPFLSIQSPVQLPRVSNSSDDDDSPRRERWRKPSGFGIRFSAALGRTGHLDRLEFTESLRRFCSDRGLGLWLGDRRPGYRSGNWFRILQHSMSSYREYEDGFRANNQAIGLILPCTAIGPARVGTTRAIIGALNSAGVPVLSTTVLAARDMSFIHLGIAIRPVREQMDKARAAVDVGGIASITKELCELSGGKSGASFEPTINTSVAGDYIGTIGGAVQPRFSSSKSERVLWAAWEVPAYPSAGPDSVVALIESLAEVLGLRSDEHSAKLPSVEYLLLRRSSGDRIRCRAKLSVDRQTVFDTAEGEDTRRAIHEFCNETEQRFRNKLASKDASRTSDASIGWRESWLGRWSASARRSSNWR